MAFQVIEPIAVNDTIFIGSNVPETDLQEWVSGTAYVVGDTVMVATSVANIHKTYECLVAPNTGLTPDILNEDCVSIADWTNADWNTGVTEVSPAGQFRFDTNLGAAGDAYSAISRTLASPPNTFTLEIRTYFDSLGSHLSDDSFIIRYDNTNWSFAASFGTDGLFISKATPGETEVGVNIVKYNDSATWQTWRFQVTKTVVSTATVEVFLKEEGVFVSQGTVDCNYEDTPATDGRLFLQLKGWTTNNIVCHVDYIKIATGLGPINVMTVSPVDNSDWLEIDTTNRWKTFNNILGSQTEQTTKIEYVLTPGEIIDSVALLNLESDTIDIVEIDGADNLVTNGTAWTGATGTTQPTGWDKVGTPSDYTIDGGMLRITVATNGNEGVSQTIAVSAATEYQLLGLYKDSSTDVARYAIYDMTHSAYIVTTTDLASNYIKPLSFSCVFTTPTGCTSIKILCMGQSVYSGDTVWFDSIILAPTEYSETVMTGTTKTDVVKLDIPEKANGILTVTINKSGTAAIGELIIGNKTSLGSMLYSPQIGFRSYSTKTQDTFGNWTITPRGYSKKLVCSLRMDKSTIDSVFKFLCDHKDDMLVWVGEETYNSLIVYGFCKEPQIVIPYSPWAACSLEIEGMI